MSGADDEPPILLVRARNDAFALRKLADDPRVADEIVGFHAQQVVEKAFKAVLETRAVDYPYTHDLGRLFKLLEGSGAAPPGRDDALELIPWAAEFRYGDLVVGSLDRAAAITVAATILDWAEREIA